jgi:hypothetical protein
LCEGVHGRVSVVRPTVIIDVCCVVCVRRWWCFSWRERELKEEEERDGLENGFCFVVRGLFYAKTVTEREWMFCEDGIIDLCADDW